MTMVALKELKNQLKKDIDNADEKTVLAIRKLLQEDYKIEDPLQDGLPDVQKKRADLALDKMKKGKTTSHDVANKKINEVGTKQKKDWWDEANNEEKASIQEGLNDIKSGRVTPHEEVWKKYSHRIAK